MAQNPINPPAGTGTDKEKRNETQDIVDACDTVQALIDGRKLKIASAQAKVVKALVDDLVESLNPPKPVAPATPAAK